MIEDVSVVSCAHKNIRFSDNTNLSIIFINIHVQDLMLPYKLQEGAEYKGGLVNINNCTVATRVYLVNTSKHKPHTSSEYTTVRNVYYF